MKREFTPKTTKVVFFDMNNTLIDPRASFDSCFLSVLADFTGRWDPGSDEWSPQAALDAYRAEWRRRTRRLKTSKQADAVRKLCLETALRPLPFQVNDAFVGSFFREMRNQARDHAELFPQAAETVKALARSYEIGIITNGAKEHQERVVRRHQLSDAIRPEHIFASNHSGARKPQPAIFQLALRGMKVRPAEAVMVGDSWKNDVEGAVRCGMHAVWLSRAYTKNGSRRKLGSAQIPVVRNFQQLKELFGAD